MIDLENFSFLVTTDNHMGFKQDDHIRRKDSYMAFAEALHIARDKDVDFILLGGDLFHINKPSTNVEHKCIKIIRQHMNAETAGKQTTFRRIKGELCHFERLKHANFEDPNLRVQYPIFTIHGNHDDPTGPNAKSVCEKLATCGLLNYFGLVRSVDKKIKIESIVLQKGSIKIALYGIGFIPDLKLRSALERGNVQFEEPAEDTFNVLIIHQNRIPIDKSKYIPDDMFPKFFHLFIRGHEHNTQAPTKLPDSSVGGIVYQPGSTVATSITAAESGNKRVCVMTVKIRDPAGGKATRYRLDHELIPLKCCRPMILKDIPQKEIFKSIKSQDGRKKLRPDEYRSVLKKIVIDRVEKLLDDYTSKAEAATQISSQNSSISDGSIYTKLHRFNLPLMRLRLEYVSKAERFDDFEVSSLFYPERVANRDIILFKKQKIVSTPEGQSENVTFNEEIADEEEDEDDIEVINLAEERKDTIDTMIESYFEGKDKKDCLMALSIKEYTNAVRGAVEDGNVISKVLSKKKVEVMRKYNSATRNENTVADHFHNEALVRDWFIEAFKEQSCDSKDIVQNAISIEGDDDDDIVWED